MTSPTNQHTKAHSQSKNKLQKSNLPVWKIVIGVLILLFVGYLTHWFLTNFHRVTNTSYQLTERANYNPYYAAELLINEYQSSTEVGELGNHSDDRGNDKSDDKSNDSRATHAQTLLDSDIKALLADMPELSSVDGEPRNSVLIINSMETKLSNERFDILRRWVEQGGHLITFTGRAVDHEDLDEIFSHIDALKAKSADDKTIQNDAELQQMLNEVNTGNYFLAQLGIIATDRPDKCHGGCQSKDDLSSNGSSGNDNTTPNSGGETDEELQDALDQLEDSGILDEQSRDGIEQTIKKPQDDDKPATEAEQFASKLDYLVNNYSDMAIVTVPMYHNQHALGADAAGSANASNDVEMSEPMLIRKPWADSYIDTKIFNLKYPSATESRLANTQAKLQADTDRATRIRTYLTRELKRLRQANKSFNDVSAELTKPSNMTSDKASSNTTDKPKDDELSYQYDDGKFARFIDYLLKQDDQTLAQVFAPASEGYVDVPFGNGRISVISERDSFINPDPNHDIYGIDDQSEYSSLQISEYTALGELIHSSYTVNLSTADNSRLLIALTQGADEVWILPNTDIEALPLMLWRHARIAVLGLALLLLLWLWSLYDRFGKAKTLSEDKSHDILRYFHQVGRYGWDYDRAVTLLRLTRQQTKQRLYENLPKLMTSDSASLGNDVFGKDILSLQRELLQTHANNPNANPLAKLNGKELSQLSASLMAQYDKKVSNEDNDVTHAKTDLTRQTRLDYDRDDDLIQSGSTGFYIDAQRVLSTEHLSAALIDPIDEDKTANQVYEITQTLWLINWILGSV